MGKATAFVDLVVPKLSGFGDPAVTTAGWRPTDRASGRAARCLAPQSRRPPAEVPADLVRLYGRVKARDLSPLHEPRRQVPRRPGPARGGVGRQRVVARPGYSPPGRRTVSLRRLPGAGRSYRKAESHPSRGAPSRVWACPCDLFRPRLSEPPGENPSWYGRKIFRPHDQFSSSYRPGRPAGANDYSPVRRETFRFLHASPNTRDVDEVSPV